MSQKKQKKNVSRQCLPYLHISDAKQAFEADPESAVLNFLGFLKRTGCWCRVQTFFIFCVAMKGNRTCEGVGGGGVVDRSQFNRRNEDVDENQTFPFVPRLWFPWLPDVSEQTWKEPLWPSGGRFRGQPLTWLVNRDQTGGAVLWFNYFNYGSSRHLNCDWKRGREEMRCF